MGWSIKIKCEDCDYEKVFLLGIGFNYLPEYIFNSDGAKLSHFVKDKEERKLISEIMKDTKAQVEASEERLYRCLKCNQLYSKYYYSIKYSHGEHKANYVCSNCSYPLESIDIRNEKGIILAKDNGKTVEIKCPKCGSSKTSCLDGCFDWD